MKKIFASIEKNVIFLQKKRLRVGVWEKCKITEIKRDVVSDNLQGCSFTFSDQNRPEMDTAN